MNSVHSLALSHPWPTAIAERFHSASQRLYQFHSFDTTNLLQPDLSFAQLHHLAFMAQRELNQLLNHIAQATQSQAVIPGVKSLTRARDKVIGELNGQHRKLTDLARGTLVARDLCGVIAIYEQLRQQANVISLLNRFRDPKANGYRDLKVLLRLQDSQMVAEVQIHLEAIQQIKTGEEHRAYMQRQDIERKAAQQRRELTPWEQAKITRLKRYSRALYEEAWQRHQPTRFSA
ncbi:hypothetical protein [Ferrimonas senticii]|uniref:hypothetical protein n=1 Tax=Ferrimonas senticii TaxID=394566 RepID=UPI000403D885|nr:hypothetical protein [Ferrimonas senticii]